MRRKIISQGNNSFTVTLPIGWIRECGLKGGEDVNIVEDEGKLVMSPEIIKKKKEVSVLVDEEYEKNIRFLLNELYRQGYDKVKIQVKNKKTIEIIQSLVEILFFDMEIMEKTENSCVLEVISEPTLENYNSILKKMIFIIHESMDLLINRKKGIGNMTNKYRKYDNFCRRYTFSYMKGREGFEMYSLLVHLLMIQTDINRLSENIPKKPTDLNTFKDVAALYKEVYTAFFKRDRQELYNANKKVNAFVLKNIKKGKLSIVAHYAVEIARVLYSSIVPMIGISIEKSTE